jgi:hypothetical protein
VFINGLGEYTASFFRVITWSENRCGLFVQNPGKLVPDCTVSVPTITVQIFSTIYPYSQGSTNLERKDSRMYKCLYGGTGSFFFFQVFSLRNKTCITSHVPSTKRRIAVRFTGHCSMVELSYRICFVSAFCFLAFWSGLLVCGKFVEHCPVYFIISKQLNTSETFTEVP